VQLLPSAVNTRGEIFVIRRVSRKLPRWRHQSQQESRERVWQQQQQQSRPGLWLTIILCALLHCLRCGPPVSRDTDVVLTAHAHRSALSCFFFLIFFITTICHFWKRKKNSHVWQSQLYVCVRARLPSQPYLTAQCVSWWLPNCKIPCDSLLG
jgi:hypothetical protein